MYGFAFDGIIKVRWMLIQALSFPGPQSNTSRLPSGSNAGGVVSLP